MFYNKRTNFFSTRQRGFISYFLRVFPLLFFLIILFVFVVLYNSREDRIEEFKIRSSNQLNVQTRIMETTFEDIGSDLLFLSNLNEIRQSTSSKKKSLLREMEKEFHAFIQIKHIYDQLVYIDKNGEELAKVTYNNGRPTIVPSSRLQNKKNCKYFQESLQTPRGKIYVSRFDLDIKNGRIDTPLKPILRFALPIRNANTGKTEGVLMLHYLGDNLMNNVKDAINTVEGSLSLLNADGYWLYDNNPDNEWGFMYPDKKNLTFQAKHPKLWKKISTSYAFQTLNADALYSSQKIDLWSDFYWGSLSNPILLKTITYEEMNIKKDLFSLLSPEYYFLAAFLSLVLSFIFALTLNERNIFKNTLKKQALYDALTGLPNRRLLTIETNQMIETNFKHSTPYSLFFIDLDGFKEVNDTLGHDIGDEVLKYMANLLKSSIRSSDIVARLGGDEFVLVLSKIHKKEDCVLVAKKILQELSESFQIQQHPIKISASIGVVYSHSTTKHDFDLLLRKADEAMYFTKNAGKNNYTLVVID